MTTEGRERLLTLLGVVLVMGVLIGIGWIAVTLSDAGLLAPIIKGIALVAFPAMVLIPLWGTVREVIRHHPRSQR